MIASRRRAPLGSRTSLAAPCMEGLEDRLMLAVGMTAQLIYVGSYDSGMHSLGVLDLSNPANQDPTYFHKFAVKFTMSGLGAGQDFAFGAFNFNLGSHLTQASNWLPANGSYDPGDGSTVSYWVNNSDIGPSSTDLQGIFVADSAVVAANRHFGETPRPSDSAGYPTLVGYVLVHWDGVSTTLNLAGAPGGSYGIYTNNASGGGTAVAESTGFTDATYTFPGTLGMAVGDVSVNEPATGSANAVFHVTLSAPSSQTVTVHYATADGTAFDGQNYTGTSGDLTFNPGQTDLTVTVPVLADPTMAANTNFKVDLSAPTSVTILDNEGIGTIVLPPAPSATIGPAAIKEPLSGTANMTFHVTLSAASPQVITMHYATADGTATAGADYVATSGDLTFNPGETSKDITVTVNSDAIVEPAETLKVYLSLPVNVTTSTSPAIGTINYPGVIKTFNSSTVATWKDANGETVTVSLTGAGTGSVFLPTTGNVDAAKILLKNSTGASNLTIATTGTGSKTTLGNLEVVGSLNSITAGTTDLVGDMTVSGVLRSGTFHDATGNHLLSIGNPLAGTDKVTLSFNNVKNLTLTSSTPIASLKAYNWITTLASVQTITSPYLSNLTILKHTDGTGGNFQANLTLSGVGTTGLVLGPVSIAAGLSKGTWAITGGMGTLTVAGNVTSQAVTATKAIGNVQITGNATGLLLTAGAAMGTVTVSKTLSASTIRSANNMGAVSLGAVTGSDFLAGIKLAVTDHAASSADFARGASIASVTIKGLTGAPAATRFFTDSNFSAEQIGAVSILNGDFTTGTSGLWVLGTPRSAYWTPLSTVKNTDQATPANNFTWSWGTTLVPSVIDIL